MIRILLVLALAAIAIAAQAESKCIRAGSQEIVLFDFPQKYCPMKFVPADPSLQWKFAYTNGQPGCWRADENFVHVATNTGVPNLYPRESVENIAACKQFSDEASDREWDYEFEGCDNLGLPEKIAVAACRNAVKLAERYGDSDPRLLISIDLLSATTDDLAEAETLLKRLLDIRQKHFPSDHLGVVSTLGGIGTLRKRQHNFNGAEAAYQEAIRVGRQLLDEDHLEVAALMLLFGKMYLDFDMLPKAEEQLLLALARAEKQRPIYLTTAHSIAASSARLLADIYQKQSKGGEADRYREIARKHREAAKQPAVQDIKGPSDEGEQS
jgi:hypothetical protein